MRVLFILKFSKPSSGFTLLELFIVMGVLIVIGGVVVFTLRNLFLTSDFLGESLSNERDLENTIQAITREVRAASPSSVGSYPLALTASTSLAFFVNLDSNTQKERVQYFLEGTTLRKSVVYPSGSPLTYSTTTAQETLATVLRGIAASTTPLFSYYDKNFGGTTTPLTQPVNVSDIRHVRIAITIDKSPFDGNPPLSAIGETTVRNLKDNY